MSKQGMARPERTNTHTRNTEGPVPEIHGKSKHGKSKTNPIVAGTFSPSLKVHHRKPSAD